MGIQDPSERYKRLRSENVSEARCAHGVILNLPAAATWEKQRKATREAEVRASVPKF
jgi:hypothetical protein